MKSPVRFMARGLAEANACENPRHSGAMRDDGKKQHCHSGAMRSIEPGISRFRVWSFGPSRNDGVYIQDAGGDCGGGEWAGGAGVCEGSGGGGLRGRGGSRQAPALRPAIIQ